MCANTHEKIMRVKSTQLVIGHEKNTAFCVWCWINIRPPYLVIGTGNQDQWSQITWVSQGSNEKHPKIKKTFCLIFSFLEEKGHRVYWLVTEHLSAQGRPDPRGGLNCLWCANKTWTCPLEASDTLVIVENKLKMRKLWPLKTKGVKNSKKQTIEHYQSWFLNIPKKKIMLIYCY
jgi:hypothetical protein